MQDRGPQLAGTCASLLSLAIVAVSVRCYVRLALTKSFGYDDWLIVATLVRPSMLDYCGKKSLTNPRSSTPSFAPSYLLEYITALDSIESNSIPTTSQSR